MRNFESRTEAMGGTTSGICTLFEGDYHIGLAAFLNSLVRAGYPGVVWAGYRGGLPPWINQLEPLEGDTYRVGCSLRLALVRIETSLHFTNYKPQFMLDLLQGPARDCSYLWYFDPDIFLRCKWSFFVEWEKHGIALCQEVVNNILPADSPLRHQWIRFAERVGLSEPRPLNHYYNGGMVGIPSSETCFLVIWNRIIKMAGAEGLDPKVFRGNGWGREMPFMASDQDALNVAAMYSKHPLTTMGPEAMGLIPGGFTMFHAIGPKPWRASFLRRALMGVPPSDADKFFFTQVTSPIRVYSSWRLRGKQFSCATSALVGRFYRRR